MVGNQRQQGNVGRGSATSLEKVLLQGDKQGWPSAIGNVQPPLRCDGARSQRLPPVTIYHSYRIGQGLQHTLLAVHLIDTPIGSMTILQITSVDEVQRKLAGLPVQLSGSLLEEVVHHMLRKAEPDCPEVPVDLTQEPVGFVHPVFPHEGLVENCKGYQW